MQVTVGEHYLAYVLDEETKKTIFELYPRQYEVVRCDHVTVAYGFTEEEVPYLQAFVDSNPEMQLAGFIKAEGIELFRVRADGDSQRPLGGNFHITYSRTEERQSSDSNRVLYGEIPAISLHGATLILKGEFKLVPIT